MQFERRVEGDSKGEAREEETARDLKEGENRRWRELGGERLDR